MKITFNWSMTLLLTAVSLVLPSCGGGGGGGGGGNNSASLCANNADTFICEVFKVVNNLTSDSADPIATDPIVATSPDDAEPTTNI